MISVGIWDAAAVIAKASTYAATLGASGGTFFLAYSRDLIPTAAGVSIRRCIAGFLIAAAVAGGTKILATSASLAGDMSGLFDTGLVRMVLQAGEGRAALVRLIGLALLIPAVTVSARPPMMALAGSLLAATSFAWVGHVHALSWVWSAVLALHLLGAAFWLGALTPLLVISRGGDLPRIAATVARFGNAALAVVGVLLAAGACLLCVMLRDVAELWSGAYGRLILCKLATVACLLALAAFNRLSLSRRISELDAGAVSTFRTSIRLEMSSAIIILLITAALTTLTGPSADLSQ